MTDKYKLSILTFSDVFTSVPPEHREQCLIELKDVIDTYLDMIKESGTAELEMVEFVDHFYWVNDGIRKINTSLMDDSGKVLKDY